MTKLTTHVLDIYSGKPGNGIVVDLFYVDNNERKKINSVKLNSDGRPEKPLVEGENFIEGKYELIFYIGCLLYTSPSPRDGLLSRMPSSA